MKMSKTRWFILPVLVLALAFAFQPGMATGQAVKNPDTYVSVSFGDTDSLDPGWAYDTASLTVIFNVYEPLIFYEGGRMDRFVPFLSTAVPTLQNGLLSKDGKVYTFPIRQGVKFHDGTPLTAEDAAYSLQRFLLSDRDGGPSSLLLEPIFGLTSSRDDKGNLILKFADLQRAIQAKGNNVVITLKEPFGPFISLMPLWSFVVSKKTAIANGDWNGTAATMAKYNNPKKESMGFFEKANGTGPFKLERWDRAGRQIILARNGSYWRAPARLQRVVLRQVDEPATRILMVKAGDADSDGGVSRRELPQYEGDPNVKILDDLPTGVSTNPAFFFTVDIDCRGNPDCGSGRLDGNGIPSNFFSDVKVRQAFGYSFDFNTFLKDSIEALNPKFKIDIRGVTWSSFLAAMDAGKLPIFWIGWIADFPDPHNFAFHFFHSDGTFPHSQKFKNGEIDALVTLAVKETDVRKRQALYFQINQKYFELAPSIATVNAIGFRVQRTWVRGWYYNPIYPGTYYYTIWKG